MTWADDLAYFSGVLDMGVARIAEGPLHHRRIRCSKSTEEQGEVEEALIALEQSNPRKYEGASQQALLTDLIQEQLDVATAALGAVEHLTGNVGHSYNLLVIQCAALRKRAEEWPQA